MNETLIRIQNNILVLQNTTDPGSEAFLDLMLAQIQIFRLSQGLSASEPRIHTLASLSAAQDVQ